jgi:hypothetical protein
MLITRVRPSLFLPIAAFLWSGIPAATFACTIAGGLWTLRFVLGITEAPLFPGAVFLMSCWYARYAMTFLYAAGCFSVNTLQYTWAVPTLSQTPKKRAAAGAIVKIFGHLGNVYSPYFFPDRDAPRFTMAMIL